MPVRQEPWDTIYSQCLVFPNTCGTHAKGSSNTRKWCLKNLCTHLQCILYVQPANFLTKPPLQSQHKLLPRSSSVPLTFTQCQENQNHSVFLCPPYMSNFLADRDTHSLLTESCSPDSTDVVYFTATNAMQTISKHTELCDCVFSSRNPLTQHILWTSHLT